MLSSQQQWPPQERLLAPAAGSNQSSSHPQAPQPHSPTFGGLDLETSGRFVEVPPFQELKWEKITSECLCLPTPKIHAAMPMPNVVLGGYWGVIRS